MINVAKSLIIENNKILLIRRSAESKFFPTLWDFPGGKLEFNESPEESVIRETLEETALNITIDKLLGEYDYVGNDKPTHFWIFSVKEFVGKIKLGKDHNDYILISKETPSKKLENLIAINGMAKKSAEKFMDHLPEFLKWAKEANLENRLQYTAPQPSPSSEIRPSQSHGRPPTPRQSDSAPSTVPAPHATHAHHPTPPPRTDSRHD